MWQRVPAGHEVLEGGKVPEYWLLELLSRFSQLQTQIEWTVHSYLHAKSPRLARALVNNHVNDRLRDRERWAYVKAIASDVGYDGDIPAASTAFNECSQVRNVIAHSEGGLVLVTSQDRDFQYYIFPQGWGKPVPDPLTPGVVHKLVTQCVWMSSYLNYLGFRGGMKFRSVDAGSEERGLPVRPLEILAPPPLVGIPIDWTPTGLMREMPGRG